jgi:dienelactone hydrolase
VVWLALGAPAPFEREGAAMLQAAGFTVIRPDLAWQPPGAPGGELADAVVIARASAARGLLPANLARFLVGVGEGGLYARLAACALIGFDGAVSMGGRIAYSGVSPARPIQPMDLLPGLGCALQCHFADDDEETPPAQIDELERRLCVSGRPWQVLRHPPGESWRDGGEAAAWARARAFLLHLAAERSEGLHAVR